MSNEGVIQVPERGTSTDCQQEGQNIPRRLEPLPWYRWYPLRWAADRRVQKLSWECQGFLRALMDTCWTEGKVPAAPKDLADHLAEDVGVVERLLPAILPWFYRHDEWLYCQLIEDVRTDLDSIRLKRSEAGKKSASSRRQKGTHVQQS